jgi:hypothetical protein
MSTITPHPAKYSDPIIDEVVKYLDKVKFKGFILDPNAGPGGVHRLATKKRQTIGVEIEPEWASMHNWTICGDCLNLAKLGFIPRSIDCIFVSPCYANRMADNFNAQDSSKRHTYRAYLGREPTAGSSAVMQWGEKYRDFYREAWAESLKFLKKDGLFILNVSDHIRNKKVVPVTDWHKYTLESLGIKWVKEIPVYTRRQRHGENREARVDNEWVLIGKKRN